MTTLKEKFGTSLLAHGAGGLLGITIVSLSGGTGFDMAYTASSLTMFTGFLHSLFSRTSYDNDGAIAGGMVAGVGAAGFGSTYLLQSLTL